MPICPKCESRDGELYQACPSGDGYHLVDEDEYHAHRGEPWLGKCLGGRFVISTVLGQGAMSRVYEAYQTQVDRKVAIKIFELDKVGTGSGEAGPDDRDRFIREAQVLAKLSHPNCVTLYDFGYEEDQGFLYIAMERVSGISMRKAARRGLKFEALAEVVRQVLMALREAHALDIVHRDLKPENIILSYRRTSDEQIVKVFDFGIAKLLGRDAGNKKTRAGLLFGTPAYMSPEQCRGETNVTPASDIYSIGCMIFELVTGYLPFDSELPQELVRQHQYEPVPDLVVRSGIDAPEGLQAFVHRCMAKEPEERFSDAAAAFEVFEEIIGGETDSHRLARGMTNLGTGPKKVVVPDTDLSGIELDPTGEFARSELLAEANEPEPAARRPEKRAGETRPNPVEKPTGTVQGESGPGLAEILMERKGLVLAAGLSVTVLCLLLASFLYLAFAS